MRQPRGTRDHRRCREHRPHQARNDRRRESSGRMHPRALRRRQKQRHVPKLAQVAKPMPRPPAWMHDRHVMPDIGGPEPAPCRRVSHMPRQRRNSRSQSRFRSPARSSGNRLDHTITVETTSGPAATPFANTANPAPSPEAAQRPDMARLRLNRPCTNGRSVIRRRVILTSTSWSTAADIQRLRTVTTPQGAGRYQTGSRSRALRTRPVASAVRPDQSPKPPDSAIVHNSSGGFSNTTTPTSGRSTAEPHLPAVRTARHRSRNDCLRQSRCRRSRVTRIGQGRSIGLC